jgi:hypothetical protein
MAIHLFCQNKRRSPPLSDKRRSLPSVIQSRRRSICVYSPPSLRGAERRGNPYDNSTMGVCSAKKQKTGLPRLLAQARNDGERVGFAKRPFLSFRGEAPIVIQSRRRRICVCLLSRHCERACERGNPSLLL